MIDSTGESCCHHESVPGAAQLYCGHHLDQHRRAEGLHGVCCTIPTSLSIKGGFRFPHGRCSRFALSGWDFLHAVKNTSAVSLQKLVPASNALAATDIRFALQKVTAKVLKR